MASRSRPWLSAAPLVGLALPLVACSGAGSQLAGKAIEGAMKAALEGGSRGGGASRPKCPASCGAGNVCDEDSGRCITERMAAALARARKERAEQPPAEIPPDPCENRCTPDERCESGGSAGARCLPDAAQEP